MNNLTVLQGDALAVLRTLGAESVQTCITSPPYWGLRDYGVSGQMGLEPTPGAFIRAMVQVFGQVRRVLKDDGTLWVNIGDSYAGTKSGEPNHGLSAAADKFSPRKNRRNKNRDERGAIHRPSGHGKSTTHGPNLNSLRAHENVSFPGLKPKDLVGIPWMLALALRKAGWYLRSDIIWSKPNPMPESVTDRPTKSHEYLFLLSKRAKYFYNAEAIKEPCLDAKDDIRRMSQQSQHNKSMPDEKRNGLRPLPRPSGWAENGTEKTAVAHNRPDKKRGHNRKQLGTLDTNPRGGDENGLRNKRSVWTIATAPYRDAHFATYPRDLVQPCILAGSRPGDVVLDPFAGSGTTGMVALELGRKSILIELNPEYIKLINQRTSTTLGLGI